MAKKSEVWDHFLREGDLAKCNICNAEICCKGGCTSARRNHCRSKHQVSFNETIEIVSKKHEYNQILHNILRRNL